MGAIVSLRGRHSKQTSTIESWIRTARTEVKDDKSCSQFALVHRPSDKELHHVKLGGSPGPSDAELADLFLGYAQSYAEGISGVQSFELIGFYGSNEPQAFKPFQISGKNEFDGFATEAPDGKGSLAQGMRLTELMVQGTFRALASVHEIQGKLLEQQVEEAQGLRSENREMFTILKELLVERDRAAHVAKMEELQFQRATAEREQWIRLGPPLVNNLVGREVFPQSVADTALIEAAVDALTPEQLTMMGSVLPPEVWGPLASRMKQIQDEKTKMKLRAKELAAASQPIDPNSDTAGEQ